MRRPFKALFFDLGGTLIYFDGTWPDVMQTAAVELTTYLQKIGLQLNAHSFVADFRARIDEYYAQRETEFVEYTTALILRTLLADLGHKNVNPEMLKPALRRLYAVSQEHWKPEAETIETLAILRKRGYKLAVISNAGDDDDVQTLVDKAGIRPYLDFAISSAACGIRKPNPRIFELALRRAHIEHSEAAMVGDSLGADILGARNAGIYSIWLTRRAETAANRDHQGTILPDSTIHTLAELPQLLESLRISKVS
jgi:putative hydrolase of the HAD superfamily